jgi:voltage-gated sodium channel
VYAAARWVDYACVVYFVTEVVLKVRVVGWPSYWSSGWNRFDFIVVLLSSPVLLSHFIDVGDLSIVLALRLGRLFRLFRVMRFIPNREHLWAGIKRALRASVGVFLALVVVNVVLSLGATQLFGRYAPEYFGNPAMSSYSLFRVFTVEGWYEIPDYVAANSHPAIGVLARLYFIIAVLGGGILGLSLANAVFVDEMTIDNNEDVEAKLDTLLEEVRELRKQLADR